MKMLRAMYDSFSWDQFGRNFASWHGAIAPAGLLAAVPTVVVTLLVPAALPYIFVVFFIPAWLLVGGSELNVLYCPQCKKRVKQGAQVCRHCGTNLTAS